MRSGTISSSVLSGSRTISLHAFWDDLILGSERFQSVRNTATALRLQPDHARAQLPELTETRFEQWATQESFRLATGQGYRHGQLQGSTENNDSIILPADYIPQAKAIGERRIVLAGYRLADVLNQIASRGEIASPAGTQPGVAVSAGTQPAPQANEDGEIHGNRNTRVYHLPGCPGYNAMRQANLVTFASEAEAQQAGYRRAKNCP